MGATSVTGVGGPGGVEGKNSGAKSYTISASRLVGPRIVAAGSFTMPGSGSKVLNLPLLKTAPFGYSVQCLDNNGVLGITNVSMTTTTTNTVLTFTGGNSNLVSYAIIKNGIAL